MITISENLQKEWQKHQDMADVMKVPKVKAELRQHFKELKMELAWIQNGL